MAYYGVISGGSDQDRALREELARQRAQFEAENAQRQRDATAAADARKRAEATAATAIQTVEQVKAGGSRGGAAQANLGGSNPGDARMQYIRKRLGGSGIGGTSGPRGSMRGVTFGAEFYSSLEHLNDTRAALLGEK